MSAQTPDIPSHGRPTSDQRPEPLTVTKPAEAPTNAEPVVPLGPLSVLTPPGYELLEELGRGGMGVVYRAREVALDRDAAVKVLQDRYAPDGVAAKRFTDEARITAQLQHPAIPPVHQVGTLPDGRPFLAMKLIKGRTLDVLLGERTDPFRDRGRFVAVFEHLCQAVGYAHSRGVIHRDLKPGNVMVGAFGEVQVMDWGLAKVLGASDGDAEPSEGPTVTEVRGLRGPESATETGSVLGTPAYMSPEQAGGEVAKIDRRSDVFGLGGILCTVLTGHPPYVGASTNEVRLKAVRGDLGDCFARLDGCAAEPELVSLCRRCLTLDPSARPADAGELARAVGELRVAAEDRARRAEIERAAAEARAVEQRKRRKVQVALVLVVLLASVIGGVGAVNVNAERRAREEEAKQTLAIAVGRAEQLRNQAFAASASGETETLKSAIGRWDSTLTALEQAEELAASMPAALGSTPHYLLQHLRAEAPAGQAAARAKLAAAEVRDRRLPGIREYLIEGDIEAAATRLRKLRADGLPECAESILLEGDIAVYQGRFSDALKLYHQMLEAREEHFAHLAKHRIAFAAVVAEYQSRASEFLKGQWSPQTPLERCRLADCLLTLRHPRRAIEQYRIAFVADPTLQGAQHSYLFRASCAAFLVGLGRARSGEGDSPEERETCRTEALAWFIKDIQQLASLSPKLWAPGLEVTIGSQGLSSVSGSKDDEKRYLKTIRSSHFMQYSDHIAVRIFPAIWITTSGKQYSANSNLSPPEEKQAVRLSDYFLYCLLFYCHLGHWPATLTQAWERRFVAIFPQL